MDGVGQTDDGKIFYFQSFDVGSMSEYVNMDKRRIIPVPEGMDPTQVAGVTNPAMSSWLALKTRTTNLPKDFSVLILGATSASGRVAIPLARSLGAKRVIGAARNKAALDTLGLDDTVVIADNPSKTDFGSIGDVDVILDYIYGDVTIQLFNALKSHYPVQYVEIGSLASLEMNIPSAILRSKNLTIRGSGPGAWSMQEVAKTMPEMIQAMKDVPEQPVKVVKLADVEEEWNSGSKERLVFVP
jgi:NADPH:quinone reductase-like Zn-dependent oxidoreductase